MLEITLMSIFSLPYVSHDGTLGNPTQLMEMS